MIDLIIRAFAVVGALAVTAAVWFSAMWALSRRDDRKARAALDELHPGRRGHCEVAVERAEGGDPPSRLTIAEREAAIVHLRSYGLTYALIAERVGCTLRTAWWTCARLKTTEVGAARKWITERAA